MTLYPLVEFTREHNKPVMISECGFSYVNPTTGADQTQYAADQVDKFYSYLPMIYPEVKAVFYFDRNMDGQYALNGNAAVKEAYLTAIEQAQVYLERADQPRRRWEPLQGAAVQERMPLAVYVSFPGKTPAAVTYYVDGSAVATLTKPPYRYELDTTDVNVEKAAALGVVSGIGAGKFGPENPLTREQAAVMLSQLAAALGRPLEDGALTFADNAEISGWAAGFVGQIRNAGIMNGVEGNRFAPKDPYTHEQSIITALKLYRMFE